MDLSTRLTPVLETARAEAGQVDATGTFPQVAVDALRASGLFGLTLPADAAALNDVRRRFIDYRRSAANAAQRFPCA